MLSRLHLAVILAALQFWDEEMSPHDPTLFAGYFEEPIRTGEWITPAVRFLRENLPSCPLKYALCDQSGTDLKDENLYESLEAAQNAAVAPEAQIATVLILPAQEA